MFYTKYGSDFYAYHIIRKQPELPVRVYVLWDQW